MINGLGALFLLNLGWYAVFLTEMFLLFGIILAFVWSIQYMFNLNL